jgi:ligand-binding sensor domain-containing protein
MSERRRPAHYKLILPLWVFALVAAAAWQVWSARPKPPPPGWQTWRNVGSILGIAETKTGIFFGGSKGLFQMTERGDAKSISISGLDNRVMVNSMLFDGARNLFVGHDGGLSIFDGSRWKNFTRDDGLPDRTVRAMCRSSNGGLWLGTNNGAVLAAGAEMGIGSLKVLTTADGLMSNVVSALLEDHDGGVWFGNYAAPQGGLSRLKDGKWQHWTMKEGLPHPNVTCLMLDRDGRVWAGCGFMDHGGAAVFKSANGVWGLERVLPSSELAGIKVRSLFQDSLDRVWIGSENDGLAVRSGNKTMRVLTEKEGLADQEVLITAESRDHAIWMGTISGLNRIGPETVARMLRQ